MIPVYTQKSLDKLTWPEIQKLHKSLGLKATAGARTRRHLQQNIIASMPQPVAKKPEAIATPLTCANCLLARNIEDNRYSCTADVVYHATRGHWEGTSDCYKAVADFQPEPEVIEIATGSEAVEIIIETEAPIAPKVGAIAEIPHAYREESLIEAMIKDGPFEQRMNDLGYLAQLEMEAQLAIEATAPNSEEELAAYRCLRKIERDIKLYDQPAPELVTPEYTQIQNRMDEPKSKGILSLFKIEPFDPRILPTDEPEQSSADKIEPEGTIHWDSLYAGTIAGKKGAVRDFYIRRRNCIVELNLSNPASYEIIVVLNNFTAAECRPPNIRHHQIREAIEAGHAFNPKAFKDSPQFLIDTKDCGGIGRIMQGTDGRWWAWSQTGITGHPFPCESLAYKYLAKMHGFTD